MNMIEILESIKELKEEKVLFVTENWSIGAEGYKIIFIHPKSTGGVLVELTEKWLNFNYPGQILVK